MLRHNSLIKVKEGNCEVCGKFGPIYAMKKCQSCYNNDSKIKYFKKYMKVDTGSDDDESVAILKKDADLIFSRLIRLRAAAPETGLLNCYICDRSVHYSQAHAGHFVAREDSIVRLHPKNVRPCCFECNVTKKGNLTEYRKKLDEEENLLSDWLEAQARAPYKFWREELKRQIADWTREINQIKKLKQLK